ncbi:hypothetical protein [Stenotrophomonas maltophilia]|uniref:hypothetical protein n=1 Tax=Stenotrophomonas maltophilia TaxID=40324 RepID=UPI0039F70E7E
MHKQEDWELKVRGRDVTVRVVVGAQGPGTMIGFHVVYGPSRIGLDIPVGSRQDAAARTEALLTEMMGSGWY